MYNAYKCDRLDLRIYKGKLVNGYHIDIFNDDDSEKDLSIYSVITIKIFQKQHGTLIETFTSPSGGISFSDNTITWSATDEQTDLRPKFYYGECYGTLPEGEELIFHGIIEVI